MTKKLHSSVDISKLTYLMHLILFSTSSEGVLIVPGLVNRTGFSFVREGDINIGHLVSIHNPDDTGPCGQLLPAGVMRSESMKFAINEVNNRSDILPNITLGFVAFDDCWDTTTALSVSTYLIKDTPLWGNDSGTCRAPSTSQLPPQDTRYDVVGVIGPANSLLSTVVAPFFGVFNIPVLSLLATTDALSDTSLYQYFLRLAPPDRFEERTLLKVAQYFGWTYLSMVYSEGSYGDNCASNINSLLRSENFGICLAVSIRLPTSSTTEDFEQAIDQLVDNSDARVVLGFFSGRQIEAFMATVKRKVGVGMFLWLSGDTVAEAETDQIVVVLEGTIYTSMPSNPVPGLDRYVYSITPWTPAEQDDIWWPLLWQENFNCTIYNQNQTGPLQPCSKSATFDQSPVTINWNWALTARVYDGVYLYAQALDRLIDAECPGAYVDKSLLRECVTGDKFFQYIKNQTIEGVIGRIQFDYYDNSFVGDILISQYQRNSDGVTYKSEQIGVLSSSTNTIQLDKTKASWKIFERNSTTNATKNNSSGSVLESVCSRPCQENEYVMKQAQPCCWKCLTCRSNEIVNQNQTGCLTCPLYTWPDASNTNCNPISPTYLLLDNPISVTTLCLAILGALISVAVTIVYTIKREHRLVKATSRELSHIILVGTLVASLTAVAFVFRPADGLCVIRSIGFHGGINLLYAPLLVKNIRTYRIFSAGQSSAKMPVCVGRGSQLLLVAGLSAVEAILIAMSELLDLSAPSLKMPSPYEKYVEIYCSKSMIWFLVPLAYNIAMMILCAILGYFTRKLPENFNESGFIFVSVATTLFAWVVFIPAYFTAVYSYLQSAILGFCLILNAFVTLGCLFLRVVYAVYFVSAEKISFSTVTTTTKVGSSENH